MTKRQPTGRWKPSPTDASPRRLSDEEWERLKDKGKLADGARPQLETVMGQYLYLLKAFKEKPRAYHTRRTLKVLGDVTRRLIAAFDTEMVDLAKCREDAEKLAKGFNGPGNDVWGALALAAPVAKDIPLRRALDYMEVQAERIGHVREWFLAWDGRDHAEWIAQAKAWLAEIELWLRAAIDCVPDAPKGKDNEDAYQLVRQLDVIAGEHSSKFLKGVSSSAKDHGTVEFVDAVFAMLATGIRSGTLIPAAKRVSAQKLNMVKPKG